MKQLDLLSEDICSSRHRGNACSRAANPSAGQKSRDQKAVEEIIRRSPNGATVHEIASKMGKAINAISGRISELKAKGIVIVNGRRNGCGINFINQEFPLTESTSGRKPVSTTERRMPTAALPPQNPTGIQNSDSVRGTF